MYGGRGNTSPPCFVSGRMVRGGAGSARRGLRAEVGMRKNFMYMPAVLLCLCTLVWAGAARAASPQAPDDRLVLKNADGAELFSCLAPDGLAFGIRYIHSVAQSPVEDWFRVSQGMIFLEKTIYQDFGAGLPHNPGPGQTMSTGDGRIVISGYHKALPSFDVRVGRFARHTLLVPREGAADGETAQESACEIPLVTLAPPGSAVTFTLASRVRGDEAAR